MADKFYQQVIDTEDYNILSGSIALPIKVSDKIKQYNYQKLSFYDPSDLLVNTPKIRS